jgi:hypothetical protein
MKKLFLKIKNLFGYTVTSKRIMDIWFNQIYKK